VESAAAEQLALAKRAALWVFDQLLREGVVAYTPILEAEGVDAVVRCQDGRYRDLLILAAADEHRPTWFVAAGLAPRDNLYVVCVAWAVTPVQCWLLPSAEFTRHAEAGGLDLEVPAADGRKLKVMLSPYRNAWRLVTDGTLRPFVR
jgi:hypothetical protein